MPDKPTIVVSKTEREYIQRLRDDGSDPFPGYELVESEKLPAATAPKVHPFAKFIGGVR